MYTRAYLLTDLKKKPGQLYRAYYTEEDANRNTMLIKKEF